MGKINKKHIIKHEQEGYTRGRELILSTIDSTQNNLENQCTYIFLADLEKIQMKS